MPGDIGYGRAVLIAFDQALNAIGGGWPYRLIDRVASFFGDANHCEESFKSERLGRQLPPEARPACTRQKPQE